MHHVIMKMGHVYLDVLLDIMDRSVKKVNHEKHIKIHEIRSKKNTRIVIFFMTLMANKWLLNLILSIFKNKLN